MARNEITFQMNLKKDTNSASRTYGMYFGEAESKEPLNLKGFAKHLIAAVANLHKLMPHFQVDSRF